MPSSQLAPTRLGTTIFLLGTWGVLANLATADEPAQRTLTLAEALRIARAQQPTLRQAQGARALTEAQADVARAALLPQVYGTGAYARATANFVAQPGTLPRTIDTGAGGASGTAATAAGPSAYQTYPFWRLGVTATQLLWDFGQTPNRWRSTTAAAEAQALSVHVTEAQVALNLRVAFFTARAARDLVVVARDTLGNLEKHLAQIQGFVELGKNPEIDLTQARADLANGRVQVINAENTYDVARAQLNLAMGVEGGLDYQLSDDGLAAVEGEDTTAEALESEAVKARPELGSLRLLATSQDLGLRSAREGHLPSLGLTTSLTDVGPALNNLTWNWSGALVLSVPLFLGGQINAQIREAEAQAVQIRAQLDLEHQQVRLEIQQARLGVRAAKTVIASADDALANTRERLRLAEGRYRTGVGSVIELGDAQVAQTAAAAQRVQAEYQLFTARAQLLKAVGRP